MQLMIPRHVENILSLDLTLAGKCFASTYSPEAVLIADTKTGTSHTLQNPFGYFMSVCKQVSIEKGYPIDLDFSDDLFRFFNVRKTDTPLNSPFARKLDFNTKKTHSKAQESSGPSSSDIRAAIKKQIADRLYREANPPDRSGLKEFIAMHQAGLIQWQQPGAKELADILVGSAVKNEQEVKEGKQFVNPVTVLANSIISRAEIDILDALDMQYNYRTPEEKRDAIKVEVDHTWVHVKEPEFDVDSDFEVMDGNYPSYHTSG